LVRQLQETPTRWTTQSSIDQSVDKVRRRLAAVGVMASTVDDKALDAAALADCRVALLPYNPALPTATAEALAAFVQRVGKRISVPSPGNHASTSGLARTTSS
jgi:hypothetical protein